MDHKWRDPMQKWNQWKEERAIPQPSDASKDSGYCLESLLDRKGRRFTKWEAVTRRLHN